MHPLYGIFGSHVFQVPRTARLGQFEGDCGLSRTRRVTVVFPSRFHRVSVVRILHDPIRQCEPIVFVGYKWLSGVYTCVRVSEFLFNRITVRDVACECDLAFPLAGDLGIFGASLDSDR